MFPTQGSNPCLLHSLPLIHLGHKDCITLILSFLTEFGRWKASVGWKRQTRIFLFPLPPSFDPGVLDTATPAAGQPFSTACALTIFQWQSFLPRSLQPEWMTASHCFPGCSCIIQRSYLVRPSCQSFPKSPPCTGPSGQVPGTSILPERTLQPHP